MYIFHMCKRIMLDAVLRISDIVSLNNYEAWVAAPLPVLNRFNEYCHSSRNNTPYFKEHL